jgi:hypothetical protein
VAVLVDEEMAMSGSTRKPTAVYFTKVLAIERDYAMLVSHLISEGTDPTVSRMYMLDSGAWSHLFDVEDIVYGVAQKPASLAPPNGSVVFLGRRGNCRELVRGVRVDASRIDVRGAGYLMGLRLIEDRLFAVGTQNIVVSQTGGTWTRIDQGIFAPVGATVDRGLNAVSGFSVHDVYAVGFAGAILHWDGVVWTALESPTNIDLLSVYCATGEQVVVGAGGGIVLVGNKDLGWRDITDPAVTTQLVEAIVEFQGTVYLGTPDHLLKLNAGVLERVATPAGQALSFLSLDTADGALWAAGDESVARFDGVSWTSYLCPENT